MRPARAIALGGLTVGALDALDAMVFFSFRGVSPGRIFKGIAAGLLGPSARQGGTPAILTGIALHFFIATCIVAVYALASWRFPVLRKWPLILGPLYGIVAYIVMNEVVITLAFGQQPLPPLPVLLNGLSIHMLGVGLPAVLFARKIEWGAGSKAQGVRRKA